MRNALWLVPGLILVGACSARGQEADNGDTRPGQRDFPVGAFQSIDLTGTSDAVVTVGGTPSVRAEGPRNALAALDVRVENGVLKIGTRREGFFSSHRDLGHVTIHVTAPALTAATVTGTGDMRIDRVEAPTFTAALTGTGDMDIAALRTRAASFSVTGTGNVSAAGSADRAEISILGTGDARLDNLQAGDASVSLTGPGDVSLHASGTVSGSVMGPGSVTVRGTTRCTVSKTGPGDVSCSL